MEENKTQLNTEKDIKNLRTYTSDMADAIRTNEVSVIKIALAEKEKREEEEIYKEAEGTNASKIFLIIGGIILIASATFGAYYLIQQKKIKNTPISIINNVDTFISYDLFSNLDINGITNINDLSNTIKQIEPASPRMIKALFLTEKTNGPAKALITKNFLSFIGANPPSALARSLSDKYLLGKYSNEDSTSTIFLIFQTTDYAIAYSAMLDWEKNILRDLYVLFNINIPNSNSAIFENQWKDIIVSNIDARVLYGENGEGILYYAFVNKNNFVITGNIEALKEIIIRLQTKNSLPL